MSAKKSAIQSVNHSFTGRKRVRRSFGKIEEICQMPNLIEVQRSSYEKFLQMDTPASQRLNEGLQEAFSTIFPIRDFSERAEVDFIRYTLEEPKYDVEECKQRDMNYAAPLRVTLRLTVFDIDEDTGLRSIHDIKEQDVYMVDMPLMTENGTFVVNGTERVIVSQMHRSPGVFFDHDHGKTHSSGKYLFAARVIPYRGSWLDFEFDSKDILNVRIDRRRKLPVTTLLMAMDDDKSAEYRAKQIENGETVEMSEISSMLKQDILNLFYDTVSYTKTVDGWVCAFDVNRYQGSKLSYDLVDAKTGKVVLEAGTKVVARKAKKLVEGGMTEQVVTTEELFGAFVAHDIIDEKTGEIIFDAGEELDKKSFKTIDKIVLDKIDILSIDGINAGPYIRNTLAVDKCSSREEALMDIYRVMRPGEPPTVESADAMFQSLFFDEERYDLSAVGRVKMNARLDMETDDQLRILRKEDIMSILDVLLGLKGGKGEVDDIDHLGNRRVRSVGELMENQFHLGLLRMERAIKERIGSVDINTVMPHDLINSKPVASSVREFFGSSQLSQFMDQTNPLSEVTHKRRLSALGPGGLTRERAGFEVRDVHTTHYGRICPIETPEGPNIGLINSLSTYAEVNKYGFIESPYRRVNDGKMTDEVVYMSAMEEGKYTIAQANAEIDDKGKFVSDFVSCRANGENVMSTPEAIDFIDVSPKQMVSVATALIPFLENDDANRALMGSNMQRQAVPLLVTQAPLVGTGMEAIVARDSGAVIVAENKGEVISADSSRIVIRADKKSRNKKDQFLGSKVDIYSLYKYQRSNQNTCINQKPLVVTGQKVEKGEVIADGPSTDCGELALGRNMLVAFMPWEGYNFEDAIILSEKSVKEDIFTSVHIEEFEVEARDTKQGKEEITRDISNVGEDALKDLDESGIIRIGASVKSNDILVGKITPKGETQLSPEEKLLKAIFGEKAGDVKDTSLRVPPGIQGTVIDVKVFSRKGIDKDSRTLAIEEEEITKIKKDFNEEIRIVESETENRLRDVFLDKTASASISFEDIEVKKGSKYTEDLLNGLKSKDLVKLTSKEVDADLATEIFNNCREQVGILDSLIDEKITKLKKGDDLSPGVIKLVKVFVAMKRKLQVGDKMAGRHGNKGVVAKILPEEDMPYMDDGRPIELILNPLGVPSRMNVGQILETNLGMAAKASGFHVASPVFEGVPEAEVREMLVKSGCSPSGEVALTDGRSGVGFRQKVMVGYIYMMKLHHLVDDKIHARSTGPYSLVTQQPLGGKAQFGGQRLGEMEVWALEAYGAAYTLQEMLTVKSDDVEGRKRMYEAIVKGDTNLNPSLPESFNVLVKELQSLGLDVELIDASK